MPGGQKSAGRRPRENNARRAEKRGPQAQRKQCPEGRKPGPQAQREQRPEGKKKRFQIHEVSHNWHC